MRIHRIGSVAALLLAATLTGTGCLLIPQLKKKEIELALAQSVIVELDASGINDHDKDEIVDVRDKLDLAEILDDAGVDASDVREIALTGVAYRVSRADLTAGREIQNGKITVQRGTGLETDLVTNFNSKADAVTAFKTATLNAAGVAVINGLLAELLAEVKNPLSPASNTVLVFHTTGSSVPEDIATAFKYQVKVTVSIVGSVTVTIPE